MATYFFTSESVCEGHPDKVCDSISDAILDSLLAHDPNSRVACETLVKNELVVVAGEITSSYKPDYAAIARKTIEDIGYTDDGAVFSANNADILTKIERQSPDIAMGVDAARAEQTGAGDQGMMFGYACDETKELMPLALSLSHKLCKALAEKRKSSAMPFLKPDGKAQVTVQYKDGAPQRVDTVVVSAQHSADIDIEDLRAAIKRDVIDEVLPAVLVDADTRYFINPTGRFVTGGPEGDSGVTGRKIIVDTYGGYARHGGGCFSGKDPTKVDRSGAYMARYAAKNIVAAGLARRCEIQVAYAIGVAEPVSLYLECFGTALVDEGRIKKAVRELFDFRPGAMIAALELQKPIYKQLAAYGQIGREELGLAFEKTDKADALKALVGSM